MSVGDLKNVPDLKLLQVLIRTSLVWYKSTFKPFFNFKVASPTLTSNVHPITNSICVDW